MRSWSSQLQYELRKSKARDSPFSIVFLVLLPKAGESYPKPGASPIFYYAKQGIEKNVRKIESELTSAGRKLTNKGFFEPPSLLSPSMSSKKIVVSQL